jgi:hypothetical protein
MLRLRCVTIEAQGEKEDSLAVNRWTLPRRRPRRSRARNFRAALMIIGLFAFVCCGVGAPVVRADEAANAAARELAKKVAAQIDFKQRHLYFSVMDETGGLSAGEVAGVLDAFKGALLPPGYYPPINEIPPLRIEVTLTKNFSQRLLIAQFEKDGTPYVEMVGFALKEPISSDEIGSSVRIETQIVFTQEDPLLDFAVLKRQGDSVSEVLALGIRTIILMDQADGQLKVKGSLEIPESGPISRDVRGRLVVTGNAFEAGIGGTFCTGTVSPVFKMNCDAKAGRWSFTVPDLKTARQNPVPATNLFRVQESMASGPRTFLSETSGQMDGINYQVRTDAQGRTWLAIGDQRPEAVSSIWGDELAFENSCEGRTVLLAAGHGDFSASDFLQTVAIKERKFSEAGPAFNLPGPVMALWTESPDLPARAIIRNLKTGTYEAIQIYLSCGH